MQERIDDQAAPSRGGLIRRLTRAESRPRPPLRPLAPPSGVVEVSPRGAATIDDLAARIDRLEGGVRLVAQTLKRTYRDLADGIESARADTALASEEIKLAVARVAPAADAPTGEDLLRIVQEATAGISEATEGLAEAVGRVEEAVGVIPHLLTVSTDHLVSRLDDLSVSSGRPGRGPEERAERDPPADLWGDGREAAASPSRYPVSIWD